MAHGPPLLLLVAMAIACTSQTAMAIPKVYVRGVEEERSALITTGGLCYDSEDLYETTECSQEGATCRKTGKCKLDNAGFVCCCNLSCPSPRARSLDKSTSTTNFCGEDGTWYTSWCEYKKQQCRKNKNIGVRHKGQCERPSVTAGENCYEKRNHTMYLQAIGLLAPGYIPACQENNQHLYKTTQCNVTDELTCWCVKPDSNKNITAPRSLSRMDEINCEEEYRISMLSCNPCKMIKDLLKAFHRSANYGNYYHRNMDNSRRSRTNEPRNDALVAQNIFIMFDRSRDSKLSPTELGLIARWLNISRDCVLGTLSICDDDRDGKINTTEWCSCLMNRFKCKELGTPKGVTC